MAVTFTAPPSPADICIYATAAHAITAGEPVRCYRGADGKPRARRCVEGEKMSGEALNDAGPGMPVTVLVCRRDG